MRDIITLEDITDFDPKTGEYYSLQKKDDPLLGITTFEYWRFPVETRERIVLNDNTLATVVRRRDCRNVIGDGVTVERVWEDGKEFVIAFRYSRIPLDQGEHHAF